MSKNIFAYTGPGASYPTYISINHSDVEDEIRISVRAAPKYIAEGGMATMVLPHLEMERLCAALAEWSRHADVCSELYHLIGVIDGLTLPEYYTAGDRHMDLLSRAGIKSIIQERIKELRGEPATGPANAAEQFVATGRTIEGQTPAASPVQDRKLARVQVENGPVFKCDARAGWDDPAGTPADCDWPVCGCDPYADKVIAALQESDLLRPHTRPARSSSRTA